MTKGSISLYTDPHFCLNQVKFPSLHNPNHSKPCFRKMQHLAVAYEIPAVNFENICQKNITFISKIKFFNFAEV